MSFSIGDHLGAYEILAPIGAGGMGEVYRARDTKLKRGVALKVLRDAFARDPGRMARFRREAEVLASLNHPNIAHIYGVEERALVMELVEGETLPCPFPVDTALAYAKQIAEALEYAHERGVIHRDLKPANIKVTPDGAIKILDFGLAKANKELGSDGGDPSASPTLTLGHTQAGVVMGTAAYMAPEQAAGAKVDRRADIWSFGAVLYEMLSGKRAFGGGSVAETLATVMKLDPDWSALPKETPASVHKLVRRCLTKDRKQRLQAIGEARIVLQDPMADQDYTGVDASVTSRPLSWIGWAAAAAFAVIGAVVSWIHFSEKTPAPAPIQRFEIATPEPGANMGVISPDGSKLLLFVRAGAALNRGRPAQLFIHALDSLETHLLPGTEGFRGVPFWSPDSRYIAFTTTTDGKLKKMDLRVEGSVQVLCDAPVATGGFWTPDDKILFAGNGTLFQVPASGGTATPLPGSGGPGAFDRYPTPLPDGRHFLFARSSAGSYAVTYLASIDEGLGKATKLIDTFPARVIPSLEDSNLGYLLFLRDTVPSGLGTPIGTLMGQRFDLRKLATVGEPVPISERIDLFSCSRNGVLVLARPEQYGNHLTIFDRQGNLLQTLGEPDQYSRMSFSPDGSRIIAGRGSAEQSSLWMFDLARGFASRFPTDAPGALFPVWSPDGSRIVFASKRSERGNLYQRSSNGGGGDELLFKRDEDIFPVSWSRNGGFLLFVPVHDFLLANGQTQYVITMDAKGQPSGTPIVFVQRGLGIDPQFSPDPSGPPRWVAYQSTRDGKTEVYLREFDPKSSTLTPENGGVWLVSKGGGTSPRWNPNGKELLYLAPNRSIMSVELTGNVNSPTSLPKTIFRPAGIERASQAQVASLSWAISPDGKRFLFPIPVTSTAALPPVYVVLNWKSLLKN